MGIYVLLGIVFLSALVHATLQLNLGSLLLLYHSSLGKHIKKTTRSLVGHFIAGSALLIFLGLSSACFLFAILFGKSLPLELLSVLVGITFSLAIIVWFTYYKIGKTTELWLPRNIARFINSRASTTESPIEAFSLGMMICFAELPFTFVLSLISANAIIELPQNFEIIALLLYVLISILPLLLLRIFIRSGKTVAEIQRWRTKNKTFLRIVSGIGFCLLGFFLFVFKILGGF